MMELELKLVESNSLNEIAGAYVAATHTFGSQVFKYVDTYFVSRGVPDWFDIIRKIREKLGKADYPSAEDPRFYLAELTRIDSELRRTIPGWSDTHFRSWRELRDKVNLWQHFQFLPNAKNLLNLVQPMRQVTDSLGLPMVDYLTQLESRLEAILSGTYVPAPTAYKGAESAGATAEYVKQVEKRSAEILRRPPIGSDWLGELGTRRIKISAKMRDVTENGLSIKGALGKNADEKISSWLRYYPKGGEATVDLDGAVCGFSKGVPKLIGYLGEEPAHASSTPTGFVLEQTYVFTGSDVRDIGSNKLLSKTAREPVKSLLALLSQQLQADQLVFVTSYGQVLGENDDRSKVLATVHPGIWFPGHLPEGFGSQS